MEAATAKSPALPADSYGTHGRPAWVDLDWSKYRRTLEINGSDVHFVDVGDPANPAIVYVHGLSGCWGNWLENILPFADDHRVIAIDLPGFGISAMPREKISIVGYAKCVADLCAALSIKSAVVVGNSMGGQIAAQVAVSYPELVERIFLVSPAGIATAKVPVNQARTAAKALGRGMISTFRFREFLSRRPGLRELALGMVVAHPRQIRAELAFELISGIGKPGFADATVAVVSYPLREQLPKVSCPALIVWGTKDRVITVRDAVRFERLIPNSRKVIYEDTGHMSMAERPGLFNKLVADFIAE